MILFNSTGVQPAPEHQFGPCEGSGGILSKGEEHFGVAIGEVELQGGASAYNEKGKSPQGIR